MNIPMNYGALLLGALFASFLSGLNTLQTILYFRLYPGDLKLVKGVVTAVWLLDIVHTAFLWEGMWYYFIEGFGNEAMLNKVRVNIPGVALTTTTLTLIVHIFYAKRIFLLSYKNRLLVVPILTLALARAGSGIAATSKLIALKTFSGFAAKDAYILSLGLTFTCVVDVFITICMYTLLRIGRRDTIRLSNVIDRLSVYTVEAGLLTGCASLATAILWFIFPASVVFLGVYFSIAKLFAGSFMASLNSRYQLRHATKEGFWHSLNKVARGQGQTEEITSPVQFHHAHADVTTSCQYGDVSSASA